MHKIGSYTLLERLAAGVHIAQTERGGRVLVKMMAALPPEQQDAFLAEKSALMRLEHPHILPVVESGVWDDRAYAVFPFLSGGNLAERIARRLLPYPDIARITEQIASALVGACAVGVVHGNLRPSQVLFDEHDNLFVSDFGLPRSPDPAYYFPAPPFDHRADIYALGVLLHQMVTGGLPFPAHDHATLRDQHLHTAPPLPARANEPAGYMLDQPIQAALAKDPAQRPSTAIELAAMVKKVVEARGTIPQPAPLPDAVPLFAPQPVWVGRATAVFSDGAVAQACAWLADGFVVGCADGAVYRWRGGEKRRLAQTDSAILSLSASGDRFMTTHADGLVRVWDANGGLWHVFQGHRGAALCVSLAGDGLLAATGGEDGTLRIWDLFRGGQVLQIMLPAAVLDCSMNEGGQMVLAGCADHSLQLWHAQTGEVLQSFVGHRAAVTACELKGELVFSGAADGELRVWDIMMQDAPMVLHKDAESVTACRVQEQDGLVLGVSTGQDGGLRWWDLRSGVLLRDVFLDQPILCCSIDADYALCGAADGAVHLQPHHPAPYPAQHTDRAAALHHHNGVLLSAGYDQRLYHLATSTGEALHTHELAAPVTALALSGNYLFVGYRSGLLHCLDRESFRVRWEARAHQAALNLLVVLDEKRLATGGADGILALWNPVSGARLSAVALGAGAVRCGAVRDGLVIAGAQSGELAAWDVMTGKRRYAFRRAEHPVTACCVAGQVVAAGFADGLVALWRGKEEQPFLRFRAGNAPVTALVFDQDGRWLLAGDLAGDGHLWDINTPERAALLRLPAGIAAAVWVGNFAAVFGDVEGELHRIQFRV